MKFIIILLISCLFFQVLALDHNGIRNARNLLKEKRYDEAVDLCRKMAEKTEKPKDKQYYVEMAFRIALKGKNKDKAEKLLDLLDDPMRKNYVLMKFFPPKQVIAQTVALDLSAMPKKLISDAYAFRGIAFMKMKNNERALEDMKKSLEFPGGRMRGLSAKYIGDMYFGKDDEESAEKYYKIAVASTPGAYSWRCRTIVTLSEILVKKGKGNEALNLYSEDLMKRANRMHKAVLYSSKAKTLIALDKKSEALGALEKAVKNADGKHREALQNQLNKLAEDML